MSTLRNTYNPIARKYQTHDWGLGVAMGQVPGVTSEFVIGVKCNVNTSTQLIWDEFQGDRTDITGTPQPFFASSSDAGDVGVLAVAVVLDENYDRRIVYAVLNGQTAVEMLEVGTDLPIDCLWLQTLVIQGLVQPIGNVYAAVAGILTDGVPTLENAHGTVIAGNNTSRIGAFMVPRGKIGALTSLRGQLCGFSGKSVEINTITTQFERLPVSGGEFTVAESGFQWDFPVPVASTGDILGEPVVAIPEKSKFEYRARVESNAAGQGIFVGADVLVLEESLSGRFNI